jgi:hypothetical protein
MERPLRAKRKVIFRQIEWEGVSGNDKITTGVNYFVQDNSHG